MEQFGILGQSYDIYDGFLCFGKKCKERKAKRREHKEQKRKLREDKLRSKTERRNAKTEAIRSRTLGDELLLQQTLNTKPEEPITKTGVDPRLIIGGGILTGILILGGMLIKARNA